MSVADSGRSCSFTNGAVCRCSNERLREIILFQKILYFRGKKIPCIVTCFPSNECDKRLSRYSFGVWSHSTVARILSRLTVSSMLSSLYPESLDFFLFLPHPLTVLACSDVTSEASCRVTNQILRGVSACVWCKWGVCVCVSACMRACVYINECQRSLVAFLVNFPFWPIIALCCVN